MILGLLKDNAWGKAAKNEKKKADPNVIDLCSDSETEPDTDDEVEVVVDTSQEMAGWGYIGSHNFTQSAWGNLSGTGFNPVLNVRFHSFYTFIRWTKGAVVQIRNYELGVVFPLKDQKAVDEFICWERPVVPYGRDEPWVSALVILVVHL